MCRRRRAPSRLLAAALLVPSPLAARAPQEALPADSIRYLGGITVDVARPVGTTGGSSAVVVDLDSLVHGPAPSLEDVVRSLPLIQVRSNSRGEAQPTLRGSEDRQITILMDGVPVSLGWDHRTDMSVVPLTAARTVTLVRGLSSVLHGPNTLGGVLEVDLTRSDRRAVTVEPFTASFALDQTGGTSLSATAGHLIERGGDQWVLRGGAGFHDRPGVPVAGGLGNDPGLRARFLSDGGLRLNSDARRVDGFLAARYRAEGGGWASASMTATDVERGVPPEAHLDAPRLWRYPSRRRLIAAASAGTGERPTGLGTAGIEASLGVDVGSSAIDRFASEAFRSVAETEEADDRVVSARLLGSHSLGALADVRTAASFADIRHDEAVDGGAPARYHQRLWSLGLEAGIALGEHRGTRVSLGGAVDGTDTPEAAGAQPAGAMTDYGVRVGASSLIRSGVLAHAGVSRRSRFPSLREAYSTALGRFEPNPAVRPETLLASEAGFTTLGRLGELQIVGFHHRTDDGIVRTSVIGPGGGPLFRRVNQATVRSTGLEALVVADLTPATFMADLTVQSVKGFDAAGAEVPLEYEPSILAKVRFDTSLPARLAGGAALRFVGEQRCENPEIGGLQTLASSRSVDVSLRRDFDVAGSGPFRRLGARASVVNATDAAVFDQCGLPQPGRLLHIQLRVF